MGRNDEYRFGQIPQVRIGRSVFKMTKNVKTTFNTGYIVPFYVDSDILPGDTWKLKQSIVCRMSTPIYPVMDNLVLDTYFFAVPYRLVWDNFQKFMGENENGAWTQTTEYETPMTKAPASTGWTKGSIGDYMGLPIGKPNIVHSVLPIRAYRAIYNYFFRNQNLIAPVAVLKTDSAGTTNIASTYQTLFKASRLPDYLSTCLPSPQKSANAGGVSVPIGTRANISFPSSEVKNIFGTGKALGLTDGSSTDYGLKYSYGDGLVPNTGAYNQNVGTNESGTGLGSSKAMGVVTNNLGSGLAQNVSLFNNLGIYADLTNATAATINALRLAFQTQRIYEKDARGGTRYPEIIKNHFGTISPDGRQQRPEYLGGKRIPITMNQVAQTSSTDNTSPQGNVSAFSVTADFSDIFTKSFTEHTIIIGCMVARILKHSYQQNLPRMWTRKKRLDYYFPTLAHLGEQPVYNKEIYAQGTSADDDVFGYQERWAEYKYKDSQVTGEFRSTYTTPLDSWHYGDKYNSLPVLSQQWLEETDTYVGRTLAVTSQDQFLLDTDLIFTATRPMPVYCEPGLIDHF